MLSEEGTSRKEASQRLAQQSEDIQKRIDEMRFKERETTLRYKAYPPTRMDNSPVSIESQAHHSSKHRRLNPGQNQDQNDDLRAEIKIMSDTIKTMEGQMKTYRDLAVSTYPDMVNQGLAAFGDFIHERQDHLFNKFEGEVTDTKTYARESIDFLIKRVDRHEELLQISNHQMKLQHEITQCLFEAQYTIAERVTRLNELINRSSQFSGFGHHWHQPEPLQPEADWPGAQQPEAHRSEAQQSEAPHAEMPDEQSTETEVGDSSKASDTSEFVVVSDEEADEQVPTEDEPMLPN